MGASPSQPSAEQLEQLEQQLDESCRRAGAAIGAADVLLLLTGAGWSADSGLAVYKDIADVEAYRRLGLTYRDLCQPEVIEEPTSPDSEPLYDDAADADGGSDAAEADDRANAARPNYGGPPLFYGFWGACFNDYRDTAPHEGYAIVRRWRDELFASTDVAAALRARGGAGAFYSFTSNVDHHSVRAFGADCSREVHGTSEFWQSVDGDTGRWAAPPGYRFRVDRATMLAPEGAPERPSSAGGPCWETNHPTCPSSGARARPAILMFGDAAYLDDEAQAAAWERWTAAVLAEARAHAWREPPGSALRVVLLEVGCGGTVRTVRHQSEALAEELLEAGAHATLVRVNPDLPLADDPSRQPQTISVLSTGLAAIQKMDDALRALDPVSYTHLTLPTILLV